MRRRPPTSERPSPNSIVIDIIVPTRTDAYFRRVVESLLYRGGFRDGQRRIIIGDNGLTERPSHPALQYVDIQRPFNFARAINACAAASDPRHDLLILNDDTRVSSFMFPIWVERALAWGREEGFGLISPRINGGVGNADQTRETPFGTFLQTRKPICFMAAAVSRHVWNQVGPLDERFTGYGCEDADYSRRVVEHGYKLGVAGWFAVEHGINGMVQSGTFQTVFSHEEYSKMGQRALRIYEEKWGPGPQLGAYELAT